MAEKFFRHDFGEILTLVWHALITLAYKLTYNKNFC